MVSFESIFGLTSIIFVGIAHKCIKLPYLAKVNIYIKCYVKYFQCLSLGLDAHITGWELTARANSLVAVDIFLRCLYKSSFCFPVYPHWFQVSSGIV